MRTRQYAKEAQDNKPIEVLEGEAELANHNSRSATLETFVAYCTCRRTFLKASLAFYSSLDHRRRRRKSKIKQQKSERRFFEQRAAAVRGCTPRTTAGDGVCSCADSGAVHEQDVSKVFRALWAPSDASSPLGPSPTFDDGGNRSDEGVARDSRLTRLPKREL